MIASSTLLTFVAGCNVSHETEGGPVSHHSHTEYTSSLTVICQLTFSWQTY